MAVVMVAPIVQTVVDGELEEVVRVLVLVRPRIKHARLHRSGARASACIRVASRLNKKTTLALYENNKKIMLLH